MMLPPTCQTQIWNGTPNDGFNCSNANATCACFRRGHFDKDIVSLNGRPPPPNGPPPRNPPQNLRNGPPNPAVYGRNTRNGAQAYNLTVHEEENEEEDEGDEATAGVNVNFINVASMPEAPSLTADHAHEEDKSEDDETKKKRRKRKQRKARRSSSTTSDDSGKESPTTEPTKLRKYGRSSSSPLSMKIRPWAFLVMMFVMMMILSATNTDNVGYENDIRDEGFRVICRAYSRMMVVGIVRSLKSTLRMTTSAQPEP